MRGFRLTWLLLICPLPLYGAAAQEKAERPTLVLDAGGHTGRIHALVFTADGKRLISRAEEAAVRIWDCASGESLRVLRLPISPEDRAGPGNASHAMALSADGRLLALAGWGGKSRHWIYLYDLTQNKVVRVLRGYPQPIVCLAFSADGKRLVSGSGKVVHVWDVATGGRVYKLTHDNQVGALAFSPNGGLLATSCRGNGVRLWSMTSGDLQKEIKVHPEVVLSLAWSPDGKILAGSGARPVVHLWDSSGDSLGDLTRKSMGPGLSFSADGGLLLAGTSLVEMAQKKEFFRFSMPLGVAQASALAPDGRLAVCGSVGPELYLWTTGDGEIAHHLGGRDRPIADVAWSPDGETIGWQSVRYAGEREFPSGTFRLPELKFGGMPSVDFQPAQHQYKDLSLKRVSPSRLALQRSEETVHELKPPPSSLGGINTYSFVGDKYVAVGQANGLYLLETESGKLVRTFQGAGAIRGVAPAPGKDYFVAGGIDEILRVYTPERDAPLLLLYVCGDDWIAWTPEGYYAASPAGERLMGWQVSGDPMQLPTFYAAAQFRKSLYRPDVIRRLLQTHDVAKALELADREKGQGSKPVDVEQVLPPRIDILEPAVTNLHVTEAKLTVKAIAHSVGEHPVTGLQLLLDGRPYEGQRGLRAVPVPEMGAVEKQWTVLLSPGSHHLTVVARSAVSSSRSHTIDVLYEPAAAPDPKDLRSSLYLLGIGINRYPGDLKLNYAVQDARELLQAFSKQSKPLFRDVQSQLLVDHEATRTAILDKLGWLKKEMKPHDVAVIFYAGHGHRDAQGRFYLLSINMDPDRLDETTVTGEELKKRLADLPGRVLLLMDACHAGAIGGRGKGLSITDDLARELSDDDCGVIVMCAAMGSEESSENSDEQHGFFTLALLEGLKGAADYNKDGLIQLTELDLYVDNRVAQLSNDEQHPVTAKPTTIRSFALAKYR
jgi:hypothetical protein